MTPNQQQPSTLDQGRVGMTTLAFIDVKATGLNPIRHEILDIAVLRVDGQTLVEHDRIEVRVRPDNLSTAEPTALALAGYSEQAWEAAAELDEAILLIAPLLVGARLAGHNVGMSRSFLEMACFEQDLRFPEEDPHVLDTATLAWPLLATGTAASLSLQDVCFALGMGRHKPPRSALVDANRSLEVARRLLPTVGLSLRIGRLQGDEPAIIDAILARIDRGRHDYGPWRIADGRDYRTEVLAEVFDAMNYCAAEMIHINRQADKGTGQLP